MNSCPLSTDELLSFTPKQILFRRMRVPNDPNAARYDLIKRAVRWSQAKRAAIIDRFYIRNITVLSNDPEEQPEILDLPVYRGSCIILMISRNSNWEFSDEPIIVETNDPNCLKHRYGGLRFVARDGTVDTRKMPGCKLIYFQARHVTGTAGTPYRQTLKYQVVRPAGVQPSFIRATTGAGVMIDPDIRHPGVGGQAVDDQP